MARAHQAGGVPRCPGAAVDLGVACRGPLQPPAGNHHRVLGTRGKDMSNTRTTDPLLRAEVRLAPRVVYRDFASETVVLNMDRGQYHGLNPTAGAMLAALDEFGSIEPAAAKIAAEHDGEIATVIADMCALCHKLS